MPTPVSELVGPVGDVDFMTSLARGLAVIRACAERRRALTIAELSRAVGIPRAAVRRCLHTLVHLGYVSTNAGVFSLTPKVLELAGAPAARSPRRGKRGPRTEAPANSTERAAVA